MQRRTINDPYKTDFTLFSFLFKMYLHFLRYVYIKCKESTKQILKFCRIHVAVSDKSQQSKKLVGFVFVYLTVIVNRC